MSCQEEVIFRSPDFLLGSNDVLETRDRYGDAFHFKVSTVGPHLVESEARHHQGQVESLSLATGLDSSLVRDNPLGEPKIDRTTQRFASSGELPTQFEKALPSCENIGRLGRKE